MRGNKNAHEKPISLQELLHNYVQWTKLLVQKSIIVRGSAFSDKSNKIWKTRASKNTPDLNISEKLKIWGLHAVKTQPVFIFPGTSFVTLFVFTFSNNHCRKMCFASYQKHSILCRSFRIARVGIQGFRTKSFVVAVVTLASNRKVTEGLKIGPTAC